MEYIRGPTLLEYISSFYWKIMTQDERLELTTQIILNLTYNVSVLHNIQIVHRDLKPDNIIINDNSEKNAITLIDFGLAFNGDMSFYTQRFMDMTYYLLDRPALFLFLTLYTFSAFIFFGVLFFRWKFRKKTGC